MREAVPSKASGSRSQKARIWRRALPALVVLTGLGLAYILGLQDYFSLTYLAESRDTLKGAVQRNPFAAAVAFVFAYAMAVALSFPAASVLTLFAGFLFGWLIGGILVAIAATAGASALFLAARSTFGDFLTRRLGDRVRQMAQGFEEDAFNYLLVLRLAPVFPFWIVNIAPALFDVRLRTYAAATFLGILPGTFAYAYLGQGLESALVAAAAAGKDLSIGDLITVELTIAFVALAAVAAIPLIVRKIRGKSPERG